MAQTKIWVGSLDRSRLCMRKKRRVCPHTAALARSDIRAPTVRARVINLAIVPSAARSSPASPLSVAYLLGDPAARSSKGDFHEPGRIPAGPAARLGHGGGTAARPLARLI